MRPTGVWMVSEDQDDAFRGQHLLQLGTSSGYLTVVDRVSCSNLDKTPKPLQGLLSHFSRSLGSTAPLGCASKVAGGGLGADEWERGRMAQSGGSILVSHVIGGRKACVTLDHMLSYAEA